MTENIAIPITHVSPDSPRPGQLNVRTDTVQTWNPDFDSKLLFLSMWVSIDVLCLFLQTVIQNAYPSPGRSIPQGLMLFGQHH
jgi:hypothetical protein